MDENTIDHRCNQRHTFINKYQPIQRHRILRPRLYYSCNNGTYTQHHKNDSHRNRSQTKPIFTYTYHLMSESFYGRFCFSFSTKASIRVICFGIFMPCGQCGLHTPQPMQCDACRNLGTERS